MASVQQQHARDLEALDRGVVEAGLLAARANARVDDMEDFVRWVAAVLGVPAPPPRCVRRKRHLGLVAPPA